MTETNTLTNSTDTTQDSTLGGVTENTETLSIPSVDVTIDSEEALLPGSSNPTTYLYIGKNSFANNIISASSILTTAVIKQDSIDLDDIKEVTNIDDKDKLIFQLGNLLKKISIVNFLQCLAKNDTYYNNNNNDFTIYDNTYDGDDYVVTLTLNDNNNDSVEMTIVTCAAHFAEDTAYYFNQKVKNSKYSEYKIQGVTITYIGRGINSFILFPGFLNNLNHTDYHYTFFLEINNFEWIEIEDNVLNDFHANINIEIATTNVAFSCDEVVIYKNAFLNGSVLLLRVDNKYTFDDSEKPWGNNNDITIIR